MQERPAQAGRFRWRASRSRRGTGAPVSMPMRALRCLRIARGLPAGSLQIACGSPGGYPRDVIRRGDGLPSVLEPVSLRASVTSSLCLPCSGARTTCCSFPRQAMHDARCFAGVGAVHDACRLRSVGMAVAAGAAPTTPDRRTARRSQPRLPVGAAPAATAMHHRSIRTSFRHEGWPSSLPQMSSACPQQPPPHPVGAAPAATAMHHRPIRSSFRHDGWPQQPPADVIEVPPAASSAPRRSGSSRDRHASPFDSVIVPA